MESILRKTPNSRRTSRTSTGYRKVVRVGVRKSNPDSSMRGGHFMLNNLELTKDLESFNPTLKSILKVEELFQNKGEFDSRSQLIRELGGSMKIQVLSVILKYLKSLGKVIDNDDGSWTWIFSKNNEKLKKSWEKAEKL